MATLREITDGTGFQNGQPNAGDSRFWTYRGETNRGTRQNGVPQSAEDDINAAGGVVRYYWFEYTGTDTEAVDLQIQRMWNQADRFGRSFTLISQNTTGDQVATYTSSTRRGWRLGNSNFDTVSNMHFVPYRGNPSTIAGTPRVVFAVWIEQNQIARDVTVNNNWGRVVTNGNVNGAGWTIVDSTTGGLEDFNFTLPVNLLNLADNAATDIRGLGIEADGTIVIDTTASQTVTSYTFENDVSLGDRYIRTHYSDGGSFRTTLPDFVPPYLGTVSDFSGTPNLDHAPEVIGTDGQFLQVIEFAPGARRLEFRNLPASVEGETVTTGTELPATANEGDTFCLTQTYTLPAGIVYSPIEFNGANVQFGEITSGRIYDSPQALTSGPDFYRIAISQDRDQTTPVIETGTIISYQSGANFFQLSAVVDSSAETDQRIIRISRTTPAGLTLAVATLFNRNPGDNLFFVSQNRPNAETFLSGTYVFDGTAWKLTSRLLSVQEENGTAIANVGNITFDNRHFSVTDNGSGEVEIVSLESSTGGTAVTDGTTTAANPTTISLGDRFEVTVTDPNSADETANVVLTDVPRHRSIEFELSTDSAPGGPTPPPDRRLQTSSSASWVPAGMFGIEVRGQLFGDATSFSFNQGLPPIVQIYERPGTGSVTRSMIIPDSILIPSAGILRILLNTDIRGTIVLNGIGIN